MLKIVNGAGRVLPLPKGFKINIQKINPLFNEQGVFSQDQAYNGTVPLTNEVKLFIGLAHLPEAPASAYNFPVTCFLDAEAFGAGNFNCAIRGDQLEFNLELNYTAAFDLVRDTRLTDIFANDVYTAVANATAFAALMLDTVQHPEKYPFVFVPVKNTGITAPFTTSYGFINAFDDATQTFKVDDNMARVPFYKLTYILKNVLEYLGYEATGSFFNDPEMDKRLIYSRMSVSNRVVLPSMMYMPDMLISDFLKYCRDRLHLAINLDKVTGKATVATFSSIIRKIERGDLSAYIGTGIEIETAENEGYTVTLKTDNDDKAFADENKDIRPLFQLVAGKGSNELELDVSTLKGVDESVGGAIGRRYCEVNQAVMSDFESTGITDPSTVENRPYRTFTPNKPSRPASGNNWPLRIFKYEGWTTLTAGGHFPNSSPLDLDADDAEYYAFATDGKQMVLTGYFTPFALRSLDHCLVYSHRTSGSNYIFYLIERVSYDIGTDERVVKANLYTRTIDNTATSTTTIQPLVTEVKNLEWTTFIKAYWDPVATGMESVQAEVMGATYTFTEPTNVRGAGGVSQRFFGSESDNGLRKLIIRRGQPKFLQRLGYRMPFLWDSTNKYWYVEFYRQLPVVNYRFYYWISF